MAQTTRSTRKNGDAAFRMRNVYLLCAVVALFTSSCGTLDRPAATPYFAEPIPPPRQEFRWINGRLPRSFDPATASVPPETDVARAIFEPLTVSDPRTFEALPGVAEKWSASSDQKTWTFQLRRNARWSNGKSVLANDFVRAWNRLADLSGHGANADLLRNFARSQPPKVSERSPSKSQAPQVAANGGESASEIETSPADLDRSSGSASPDGTISGPLSTPAASRLAVWVDGEHSLTVTLLAGDPDLPKLLANPVFSPISGNGEEFASGSDAVAIVSNGPFRLVSVGRDGVMLARSDSYWNRAAVRLESVKIMPVETVDEALDAYRSGAVDAVTNIEYEPLVLKLLAPYDDFRRATHGAINLYEFNTFRPPYSDRRVREALTIAIERERLTEGEMEGATRPANRFLPFGGEPVAGLVQDIEKARKLLAAAGFPDGEGFPSIRLVVNRNDSQIRIARAIGRMWKQNLNITTELIVKEPGEMDEIRSRGEFDLIRRGIVFRTADRSSNLASIFQPGSRDSLFSADGEAGQHTVASPAVSGSPVPEASANATASPAPSPALVLITEVQALYELPALPLYFPTSYSLVKPYVQGFEPNGLDVYSLRDVVIDHDWQPKRRGSES